MNKKELKVKFFQYESILCDWVNGTCLIPHLKRDVSKTIEIIAITPTNKYQGEGVYLFYYEY